MARARCHDLDPAVELDYDMTQDPGLSPVLQPSQCLELSDAGSSARYTGVK